MLVYANKTIKKETTHKNSVRAYQTHLRQCHVTKMSIANKCDEFMPYIVFDAGEEDNQSRRLQRPIQISVNSINIGYQTESTPFDMSPGTYSMIRSPNLMAAGQTIRQNLLKANLTLQQIREVSTEQFPGQDSQLSFKLMSANAPPLPPNLQALVRSEQLK